RTTSLTRTANLTDTANLTQGWNSRQAPERFERLRADRTRVSVCSRRSYGRARPRCVRSSECECALARSSPRTVDHVIFRALTVERRVPCPARPWYAWLAPRCLP